jgi:hypothetical protein
MTSTEAVSTPDEPDLLAEFEAFRDAFLDAGLEASGVPPEQMQMWRDLRWPARL